MATTTEPKSPRPERPKVVPDDELGDRQADRQMKAAQRPVKVVPLRPAKSIPEFR